MTHVYDEVGRRSIYQNVDLFIRSKRNIQNVAIFKYSWHKFGETILPRKYQLISAMKILTIFDSMQLVYMMTQKK